MQTCNQTGRSQNCSLHTLAPLPHKLQIPYNRHQVRLLHKNVTHNTNTMATYREKDPLELEHGWACT